MLYERVLYITLLEKKIQYCQSSYFGFFEAISNEGNYYSIGNFVKYFYGDSSPTSFFH